MRGRFCEVIAGLTTMRVGEADPFLVGMFSLLDAILQRPLQGVLDEMNIGPTIRKALLAPSGEDNPLSLVLKIVKAYEQGDFHAVDAVARAIGLSPDELSSGYLQSLFWVETIFSPDEKKWRPAPMQGQQGFRRDAEARPQLTM
jgi:EAL and modified HD-GYP domain-containing signal transduction protein